MAQELLSVVYVVWFDIHPIASCKITRNARTVCHCIIEDFANHQSRFGDNNIETMQTHIVIRNCVQCFNGAQLKIIETKSIGSLCLCIGSLFIIVSR